MHEAEKWIKPDGVTNSSEFFGEHRVAKRQQRIHRIARRTSIAPAPIKFPIGVFFKHRLELLEVERSGGAFNAEQLRHVLRGIGSVAETGE